MTYAPITRLLQDWQKGQSSALTELLDVAYNNLCRISHNLMRNEGHYQTLQTHALIHEAYLRFRNLNQLQWRDRKHFFSVWSGIMRRILIDRARAGRAEKRGGLSKPINLDENHAAIDENPYLEDICDALDLLGSIDPVQKQIVELKYFTGLSVMEISEVLELSPATIKRKWQFAQTWLYRKLNEGLS